MDNRIQSIGLNNLLGQLVSHWNVENQNQQQIQIPLPNLSAGTYIVNIKTVKYVMNRKINLGH